MTKQLSYKKIVINSNSQKRFVLVIYDVQDSKRRLAISKVLKKYGFRFQRSVFEAVLNNLKTINEIKGLLSRFITESDSLKIYVCAESSVTFEIGSSLFDKSPSMSDPEVMVI